MINTLHPNHRGHMPVRVLHENMVVEFERLNPDFLALTKRLVAKGRVDPGIIIVADEEKIKSPQVIFGKITIQETFLSYLWCIAFSLGVLHDEVYGKGSRNAFAGIEVEKTNAELVEETYQLWAYAVSLIGNCSDWDKTLPNPELFDEKYKDLVPRINALYLNSVKYVLAHEFAHVELNHDSRTIDGLTPEEESIAFEREADNRSIELILAGQTTENFATIRFGSGRSLQPFVF